MTKRIFRSIFLVAMAVTMNSLRFLFSPSLIYLPMRFRMCLRKIFGKEIRLKLMSFCYSYTCYFLKVQILT